MIKKRNYNSIIAVSLFILLVVGGGIGLLVWNQRKLEKPLNSEKRGGAIARKHSHNLSEKSLSPSEVEMLKAEANQLATEEKELKQQFVNTQSLTEKGIIKRKLTTLQNNLFEKKEQVKHNVPCPIHTSSKNSALENDQKELAKLIKTNLEKELAELTSGEKIEKHKDIKNILMFYVYCDELKKAADCQAIVAEICHLIEQITAINKVIRKEEQREIANQLANNPKLHHFDYRCSIEWKGMQGYYGFRSGKQEKVDYEILIPENHPALNNVLFDNGWGTNSEIGHFYLIEGVDNIQIEPSPYNGTPGSSRDNFHKFVKLEDKITITHYNSK